MHEAGGGRGGEGVKWGRGRDKVVKGGGYKVKGKGKKREIKIIPKKLGATL